MHLAYDRVSGHALRFSVLCQPAALSSYLRLYQKTNYYHQFLLKYSLDRQWRRSAALRFHQYYIIARFKLQTVPGYSQAKQKI